MTSIYSLDTDVEQLLRTKGWFNDALASEFTQTVTKRLQEHFQQKREPRLRLSAVDYLCPCALWYSVHHPELAQPYRGWEMNKFSYGHIVEAWALILAKAAGHKVEGEQDAVHLDDVLGHRDCVIDGCIVDVKSANSRSYAKFKTGSLGQGDDLFNLRSQLDGYVVACRDDPLVLVKDRGFFYVFDQQLGKMCLYEHRVRETYIRERIRESKEIVRREKPPKCECVTLADDRTGNIRLGVQGSYNSWKYCCNPQLRCFIDSKGPLYLTKVVSKPNLIEVDSNGNRI